MPRVHKKQHRPKGVTSASATASSASPTAPAASPAPAEQLTNALTTLTLQPQGSTPPQSPRRSQPVFTPPKTPAASDKAAAQTSPTAPPDPEDLWAQILWLHDTQGLSYLDATIQVTSDEGGRKRTGADREAVLVDAAAALGECCKRIYRSGADDTKADTSPYHRAETGATVLETALRETLTTLTLEHPATLVLTFFSALLLFEKEDWEAAARKFKWLIPRAAKFPGDDEVQARHMLRVHAAESLKACGKYAEALPLLLVAVEQRRQSHRDGDGHTVAAVRSLLDCNEELHSLPPETVVPLLQLYINHLRQMGEDGDEELNIHLRMLHTRQIGLKDFAAAKETSRELMQVVKRLYGFRHVNYWAAAGTHAADLGLCGETAKSISLFSQALNHHMSAHGPDNYYTLHAAVSLGQTYHMADRHKEAVGVFERAWPASKRGLRHDPTTHLLFYEKYHNSLLHLCRLADAGKLRKEAKKRGLPVDRVREEADEMCLGYLYGDAGLPLKDGLCPCCVAKNEEEQEKQGQRTHTAGGGQGRAGRAALG